MHSNPPPRKPRVFITNDPGSLDFSKAEVFGELWRLSTGTVDPFRPHIVQAQVVAMLGAEFDADLDYILPSGAVLAVAFTFAWLGIYADNGPSLKKEDSPARVKLLLFDSKKREYIARVVAL